MSVAELRAHSIYRRFHLNNENEEVKRNLMILLLMNRSAKMAEQEDLYTCFHGSWGDGMSTDEYCKELREGISEPKEVEAW